MESDRNTQRTVEVIMYEDRILVLSYSPVREYYGIHRLNDQYVILQVDAQAKELGQAVIDASRAGQPVPFDGPKDEKEILKRMGFRSPKHLAQGARSVFVSFDRVRPDVVTVSPQGKENGYFVGDNRLADQEAEYSPESIGQAVHGALDRAVR